MGALTVALDADVRCRAAGPHAAEGSDAGAGRTPGTEDWWSLLCGSGGDFHPARRCGDVCDPRLTSSGLEGNRGRGSDGACDDDDVTGGLRGRAGPDSPVSCWTAATMRGVGAVEAAWLGGGGKVEKV